MKPRNGVKGNVQRLLVEEMLQSGKLPDGSYILASGEDGDGKVRVRPLAILLCAMNPLLHG